MVRKQSESGDLNPRQQEICELVRHQGFASIESLVTRFAVTPQTIRRDINTLAKMGLLTRYHGGAGLASSVENVAYMDRQVLFLEEKRRIAELLARHVPDNASLFINIGTTTEQVAQALCNHKGLRIITNNLNVAHIMSKNTSFEVIVAGGLVRSRDQGIIGEATIDFINQFKVDIGVIGISGIDLDGSLLDFDYREVKVTQAIMANSRQVFLAADHSKFKRNALVRLGHLSQVSDLFVDRNLPPDLAVSLADSDLRVHVAE